MELVREKEFVKKKKKKSRKPEWEKKNSIPKPNSEVT